MKCRYNFCDGLLVFWEVLVIFIILCDFFGDMINMFEFFSCFLNVECCEVCWGGLFEFGFEYFFLVIWELSLLILIVLGEFKSVCDDFLKLGEVINGFSWVLCRVCVFFFNNLKFFLNFFLWGILGFCSGFVMLRNFCSGEFLNSLFIINLFKLL